MNDRLYKETVKYFGKYAVRNRSKTAVIEDYLQEDKMIDKNGNWK